MSNTPTRKRHRAAFESPILDAMPDLLFRMDRNGRYLDFKPGKDFEPYIPPSEFLGKTMAEVLPASIAADAMIQLERAIETGETQILEYQLPVGDTHRDYEARIVALGPDDVLIIVRDITEVGPTRATERASAKAQKRYGLTKREIGVLRLVTVGMTDKEIGRRLEISAETVRKHVASLRRKMGAVSRTAAGVRAVKEGLAT